MSVDLVAILAGVHGPWVYVVVGVAALLESAAFIGLFVPGETVMLLAGVVAALGGVDLVGVMVVGAVGAVLGDQLGYRLGQTFGAALRRGHLGGRATAEGWVRAEELVARRGGPAVFIARWIGMLRAVVPAAAGAAGLSRRTFTAWNAAGGTLWVVSVVGAGYVAGASWPVLARWLGTGSVVLAGVLGGVLAAFLVVRAWRRRRSRGTTGTPEALSASAQEQP
jgi:membrane protein DedA with SNARE-associated domain